MKKIRLLLASASIVLLLVSGCDFSKVSRIENLPRGQEGRIWATFYRYENTEALLPSWPIRTLGIFAIVQEKLVIEKGSNLIVHLKLVFSNGKNLDVTPSNPFDVGYFILFDPGDLVIVTPILGYINENRELNGLSIDEIIIFEKNAVWNTSPYY